MENNGESNHFQGNVHQKYWKPEIYSLNRHVINSLSRGLLGDPMTSRHTNQGHDTSGLSVEKGEDMMLIKAIGLAFFFLSLSTLHGFWGRYFLALIS